jgi:hypothetical protein
MPMVPVGQYSICIAACFAGLVVAAMVIKSPRIKAAALT